MKWPKSLILVRHGESTYNEFSQRLKQDPLWPQFLEAYRKKLTSPLTQRLARELVEKHSLPNSDYTTPLTPEGVKQAVRLGQFLRERESLPDVIISSPYLRAVNTYEGVKRSWPQISPVSFYTEELIEERNIGLAILYNNYRFFYVFHPEQKELADRQEYYHYAYPQGENMTMVRRRTRLWFTTLTREYAGKTVLVFSHHQTILAIRANLERMSPEQFIELDHKDPPKNCSATIYRCNPELGRDGKLVLENYNLVAPGNEEEKAA